ncbi:MAG: hypothetical protein K8S55_08945 [Phycisphaerae bacterium]|nr:hypothetical protein [Phycisphaerae bacterium]
MKRICLTATALIIALASAGCEDDKKVAPAAPKQVAPADAKTPKPPPKRQGNAIADGKVVGKLLLPDMNTTPFLTRENFVTQWLVLGPFEFQNTAFGGGRQKPAIDHEFVKAEAMLDGKQNVASPAGWQVVDFQSATPAGRVDFASPLKTSKHAAAYAIAWLDCPKKITATLQLGSSDYLKVWLNGKPLHTRKTNRRQCRWDQDAVKNVTLKKGLNRIVVKAVNVNSGWDFYLRLTDKNNKPITVKPPEK